jgi:DNA-binding protein HU-beta
MNKQQIIDAVAEDVGMPRSRVELVVNATLGRIALALAAGDKEVKLTGFGTFKVVQRLERPGRNPSTGEPVMIPARRGVKFVTGSHLKEIL